METPHDELMEAKTYISEGIIEFLMMIPLQYVIMVVLTSLIYVPTNRNIKIYKELLNVLINALFWAGVTYHLASGVNVIGASSHLIGAAVACFVVIKLRIPIFERINRKRLTKK